MRLDLFEETDLLYEKLNNSLKELLTDPLREELDDQFYRRLDDKHKDIILSLERALKPKP